MIDLLNIDKDEEEIKVKEHPLEIRLNIAIKFLNEIEHEEDVFSKKNTLICLINDLEILKTEIKNQSEIYQVPEGYLWCDECQALTIHEKTNFDWSRECIICGLSTSIGMDECPNCGWEPPEDISEKREVTIHGDGCHCDIYDDSFLYTQADKIRHNFPDIIMNFNVYNRLKELNLLDCSCPTTIIYPTTNILNYQIHSVWSDACLNAIEWSYDIRCPICGNIYNVSDGNC